MGYRGIPSQGCLPCRQRRVKCDEVRPTCHRCSKAGRSCGGWRERWDLVFRDEGLKMSQKAKQEKESDESNKSGRNQIVSKQPTPPQRYRFQQEQMQFAIASYYSSFAAPPQVPLTFTIDEKAMNYFSWSYCSAHASQQSVNTPGFLGVFETLYRTAETGSLLEVTGRAVCLAAFGERIRDKTIVMRSHEKYITAMRLAREQILSQKKPSNEALLSILLLGLYEQISCPSRTLAGWATHMKGALELAKLHPGDAEEDMITKKLLIAIQNQNMIGLIQSDRFRNHPILTGTLGQFRHDNKVRPLVAFFQKILLLRDRLEGRINYASQPGSADASFSSSPVSSTSSESSSPPPTAPEDMPYSEWREIMDEALFFAALAKAWPETVDGNLSCTTIPFTNDFPSVHKPPISLLAGLRSWTVYPAVWASTIWNAFRIARILTTVSCMELEQLGHQWFGEVPTVGKMVYQADIGAMAEEILSSVPSVLFPELLSHHGQANYTATRVTPTIQHIPASIDWNSLEPPKAGNALALLWPLHFVSSERFIPRRAREQANETLQYIGENCGLKIANLLGNSFPLQGKFIQSEKSYDESSMSASSSVSSSMFSAPSMTTSMPMVV